MWRKWKFESIPFAKWKEIIIKNEVDVLHIMISANEFSIFFVKYI